MSSSNNADEVGRAGTECDFWGRQHMPLHLDLAWSDGLASKASGIATIITASSKAWPRISARWTIP